MFRKAILSASVVALFATQAEAAVLQLQGIASVDNGGGFVPATNNMQVNPGDRVRVNSGFAYVVYDNGYQSKVGGGQMAVVVPDAPRPVFGRRARNASRLLGGSFRGCDRDRSWGCDCGDHHRNRDQHRNRERNWDHACPPDIF